MDMFEIETLHWVTFLGISSFILLLYLLTGDKRDRLDSRLDKLAGKKDSTPPAQTIVQLMLTAFQKIGAFFIPSDVEQRTQLQARLTHAGYYGRQAVVIYMGAKILLTIGPALVGLVAGLLGLIPISHGLIFGTMAGISGMIGPSFWLDNRKAARQMAFRRALPDAMDVLVICLEGGVSLPAAVRRVSAELRTAHPSLAWELMIVQREMQLGRTTGEAMRQFAERCDLEEIRNLASVINQSERFGASLVKTLRIHAESLRQKRLQHAEEMAQKAAIKILFPTILCIFPGIFLVVLGPAVMQLTESFSRLKQ
jgi:tight adherence protein C